MTPMPPKKQTRVQVRTANDRENDETFQASASTSRATPTDRATPIVLPEHEIDQDHDRFHAEDDDHPRPAPIGSQENNPDDLMSSITDDDRVDMITQNRMRMKLLLERQAELREERKPERERIAAERAQWEAERERMSAERRPTRQSSNDPTNFKMVDPERYCGGISELDNFLSVLPGSFKSHSHLFPHGGPNQVQYALNFLGRWYQSREPYSNKHEDGRSNRMGPEATDIEPPCDERLRPLRSGNPEALR